MKILEIKTESKNVEGDPGDDGVGVEIDLYSIKVKACTKHFFIAFALHTSVGIGFSTEKFEKNWFEKSYAELQDKYELYIDISHPGFGTYCRKVDDFLEERKHNHLFSSFELPDTETFGNTLRGPASSISTAMSVSDEKLQNLITKCIEAYRDEVSYEKLVEAIHIEVGYNPFVYDDNNPEFVKLKKRIESALLKSTDLTNA